MREYAKKPENQSRTLDSNSKASRQAPINVILQRYKERNIQRYAEDEELIQGKFDTVQREEIGEDEFLQGKFESNFITEQRPIQREEKPNNTGLPDSLKTGIENLSGYSMDDVKVHYNSDKPAQLQALAYAQGSDIHIAPGQEQHLPHEAWHVVQQMQGRVQPTTQLQGVNVNDNEGLEKEADMMGSKVQIINSDLSCDMPKQYKKITKSKELSRTRPTTGTLSSIFQLYGAIRFANINGAYAQKAHDVCESLRGAPIIQQFLLNKNILITLESDGFNPSSIRVHNDQVRIALSPWFFEQKSRGMIVGMMVHELGIHVIPDQNLTNQQRTDETYDVNNNIQFPTIANNGDIISYDGNNQSDHIFGSLATTTNTNTANPLLVVPPAHNTGPSPRFLQYRQTIFEVASGMVQERDAQILANGASTITLQHITDAIMSYLADLAMIQGTSDHRTRILTGRAIPTAANFNLLRNHWLQFLATQVTPQTATIIAQTPGVKTADDVKSEGKSLIGRYFLSIFTKSKDNDRFAQTGGNLSAVQNDILRDYGLALQPSAPVVNGTNFFTSFSRALGLADHIGENLFHLNPANALINNFAPLVPDDYVRETCTAGHFNIGIVRPSGKVDSFGGAFNILIFEIKTNPKHYRYAH